MHVEDFIQSDDFLRSNYKNYDFYDTLTKAIARKYILEYVKYLIDKKIPFSMAIVDLDNFKLVNDNYGHNVGDDLLIQFAANLIEHSKGKTLIGRFGGDEFIIINVGVSEYKDIKSFYLDLYTCKQIIRKNYLVDGSEFYITCTAGIASYPKDTDDFDELLEKADKALYRGKAKGRNCYIIYVHEKHKDIDIHALGSKKTYDIMDELSTVFVRGASFESSIKYSLATAVSLMGFTGAFYLDGELNLLATPHTGVIPIVEMTWTDIKEVVKEDTLLQLHHIDHIKEINRSVYDYLMRYRVISLLLKKVKFASGNYGLIAFTDSSKSRIWQDDDITILTYLEKLIGITKTYGLK